MTAGEDRWESVIRGLREGDPRVVRDFCLQHGAMLERLANRHLAHGMRRRVEPEDVVQSVCRTFLRRVKEGEFQLPDAESLWRLLCAITLSKVREQTRFHLRQRRSLAQETPLADDDGSSNPGFVVVDRGLPPDEQVAFADQFEKLLASLDDEERQLVDLRLQQLDNDQIAARLGCSQRTVRRLLGRLESRLLRTLERA
jgi:RNA polymerase sigma-70 factor (ECF subfamily)